LAIGGILEVFLTGLPKLALFLFFSWGVIHFGGGSRRIAEAFFSAFLGAIIAWFFFQNYLMHYNWRENR